MIAALAAVLVLAGAPAGTSVRCSPEPFVGPGYTAWGLSAWGGAVPDVALYGPVGCAALWYAGASRKERRALVRLNPSINFLAVVGQGLLLDEHEAMHVGMRSTNECQVERAALAVLPGLLARFFDPEFAAEALMYARGYDGMMPPNYHSGC